jgi:hypothetical protein
MSRTFRNGYPPYEGMCDTNRDKKKWYKPSSIAKKLKTSEIRAKSKDILRNGGEVPNFKKTNGYDW